MTIPFTAQDAINIVVPLMIAQGKPSVDHINGGKTTCFYRGPDDCRCAIGFLIPDDQYNPEMEYLSATAVVKKLGANTRFTFYEKLQRCHDEASHAEAGEFVAEFTSRVKRLCRAEELEYPA